MKKYRAIALFLFAAIVAGSAQAQLDPAFVGHWVADDKETLDISSNVMRYRSLACDEGQCQLRNPYLCKFSPLGDHLVESSGDGMCRFSVGVRRRSKDDVLREFEVRGRQDVAGNGNAVAYVKKARNLLKLMKATPLHTLILNDAGDVFELHSDGEHLFRMTLNGAGVEMFVRRR